MNNNEIILTTKKYDYSKLTNDIDHLITRNHHLTKLAIGESVDHRILYGITLGHGPYKVLLNAAHHGNEWITSLLLMKWLENFSNTFITRDFTNHISIKSLINKITLLIIPMVNPDGVELVINGTQNISTNIDFLRKQVVESKNYNHWKANINGVDINRNYNARWYEYKEVEKKLGTTCPSSKYYSGTKPESEPETKAMVNITKNFNPDLTLSFHSQGQVIYYSYNNQIPKKSLEIAIKMSKCSGYELAEEEENESYGGYKDWYIQTYNKPGFTIEVGKGSNPLDLSQFDSIYKNNEKLILRAIDN